MGDTAGESPRNVSHGARSSDTREAPSVSANREEKASRAERRREARRRAKEVSRPGTSATVGEPPAMPGLPLTREELTSSGAGMLWEMFRQLAAEPGGSALPPSHPPPGQPRPEPPSLKSSEVPPGPPAANGRSLPPVAAPRGPPDLRSGDVGGIDASCARMTRPLRALRLQQSQPSGANGCASEPRTARSPTGWMISGGPEAPTDPEQRDGSRAAVGRRHASEVLARCVVNASRVGVSQGCCRLDR